MRIHRGTRKKGKERKKKKRKRVRPPERQSAMSAEPSSVQDSEGQKNENKESAEWKSICVKKPSQDIVTGGERGDDGLHVESWQVASLLSNPISVSVGKVKGVRLTLNSGELLQRVLWSTLPQGERRERLQEMSIRILRGWRDVGNVCNHLG